MASAGVPASCLPSTAMNQLQGGEDFRDSTSGDLLLLSSFLLPEPASASAQSAATLPVPGALLASRALTPSH